VYCLECWECRCQSRRLSDLSRINLLDTPEVSSLFLHCHLASCDGTVFNAQLIPLAATLPAAASEASGVLNASHCLLSCSLQEIANKIKRCKTDSFVGYAATHAGTPRQALMSKAIDTGDPEGPLLFPHSYKLCSPCLAEWSLATLRGQSATTSSLSISSSQARPRRYAARSLEVRPSGLSSRTSQCPNPLRCRAAMCGGVPDKGLLVLP